MSEADDPVLELFERELHKVLDGEGGPPASGTLRTFIVNVSVRALKNAASHLPDDDGDEMFPLQVGDVVKLQRPLKKRDESETDLHCTVTEEMEEACEKSWVNDEPLGYVIDARDNIGLAHPIYRIRLYRDIREFEHDGWNFHRGDLVLHHRQE